MIYFCLHAWVHFIPTGYSKISLRCFPKRAIALIGNPSADLNWMTCLLGSIIGVYIKLFIIYNNQPIQSMI